MLSITPFVAKLPNRHHRLRKQVYPSRSSRPTQGTSNVIYANKKSKCRIDCRRDAPDIVNYKDN